MQDTLAMGWMFFKRSFNKYMYISDYFPKNEYPCYFPEALEFVA